MDPVSFTHPCSYTLTHALLESQAEGAVTVVTAFTCQLLYGKGLSAARNLMVAVYEMVYAQAVYVRVIVNALSPEILA